MRNQKKTPVSSAVQCTVTVVHHVAELSWKVKPPITELESKKDGGGGVTCHKTVCIPSPSSLVSFPFSISQYRLPRQPCISFCLRLIRRPQISGWYAKSRGDVHGFLSDTKAKEHYASPAGELACLLGLFFSACCLLCFACLFCCA